MKPELPEQEPADVQITVQSRRIGLGIFRDSGDAAVYLTPDAARQIAIGLLDAATIAERPMQVVRDARRQTSGDVDRGGKHDEEDAG